MELWESSGNSTCRQKNLMQSLLPTDPVHYLRRKIRALISAECDMILSDLMARAAGSTKDPFPVEYRERMFCSGGVLIAVLSVARSLLSLPTFSQLPGLNIRPLLTQSDLVFIGTLHVVCCDWQCTIKLTMTNHKDISIPLLIVLITTEQKGREN